MVKISTLFISCGIILVIIATLFQSCDNLKKLEDTPIIIEFGVDDGCCKTSDGCASEVGNTEKVCKEELKGTWHAGKTCNITTGACE